MDDTEIHVHSHFKNNTGILEGVEESTKNKSTAFSAWEYSFYRYLYQVTVPLLFGIIAIVGLAGNGLVIFVILTRKKMRTALHFLLLNLAVADVCFLLFCIPFTAYHYAGDTWIFGALICKLFQFLVYVTAYVTVYTLVLISGWRLMSVAYSSQTSRLRTKRNAWISISVLWILALLANLPVTFTFKVKVLVVPDNPSDFYKYCAPETQNKGKQLFVSFFLVAYLIPLVAISTLHILLVKYLQQRKSCTMRAASITSESSVHVHERTSHVTRTLITVVCVFAICWLPLHIHLLIAYYGMQPQSYVYEVYRVSSHCLAYANSCMNPFIYHRLSAPFRQSFRETADRCRVSQKREYSHSRGLSFNGASAF